MAHCHHLKLLNVQVGICSDHLKYPITWFMKNTILTNTSQNRSSMIFAARMF